MKPRALQSGGTIGLICPAGAIREVEYTPEYLIDKVAGLGFRAVLGDSVGAVHGYLSGDDAVRLADIHRMFADPAIDAIWCIRGGYGTPRLLDSIDWGLLRRNPKPLFGYSDITGLHLAMHAQVGYPTLHSPQLCSVGLHPDTDRPSRASLIAALTGTQPLGAITQPEGCPPITGLVPGVAEGILIGGNLSLVAALIGTPFFPDMRGKVLFIEDVGEKTYALDRMLTHLRLAGVFDQCAAIVLGTFSDCPIEHQTFGLSLSEILAEVVLPAGKPVLFGVQAGHVRPCLSLPMGVTVRVDANEGTLTYLQSPWRAQTK